MWINSPAISQSIHSKTTSEQLFIEKTSTIIDEDVFPNSLPASPDKSSSQTENLRIIASPVEKSKHIKRVLWDVLDNMDYVDWLSSPGSAT